MLLPDRIRAEIHKQISVECRAYRTVAASEQKLLSGVAIAMALFFELLGCRDDKPHRIACLLFIISEARKQVGDDYRRIVRCMQIPHKMINAPAYSTINLGMRVLAEHGLPLSTVCKEHKSAYIRSVKAYPDHALKYEALVAVARSMGIEARGGIQGFMSGNTIDKKEFLDSYISDSVPFGSVVGRVRKVIIDQHTDMLRKQAYAHSLRRSKHTFDISLTDIVDKIII